MTYINYSTCTFNSLYICNPQAALVSPTGGGGACRPRIKIKKKQLSSCHSPGTNDPTIMMNLIIVIEAIAAFLG